jgi:protein TonB
MFGVLLESRARRQRRRGSMALSVATHVAVISAATLATVQGTSARQVDKPLAVRLVAPNIEPAPTQAHTTRAFAPATPAHEMWTPQIAFIDAPVAGPLPDIVIPAPGGQAPACDACSAPRGPTVVFATNPPKTAAAVEEWHTNELMMRMTSRAVPRYPEALRSTGVEGNVVVQFVVDTTGRIDMASIKVLSSTHELFTNAVRDALGRFRFKAAESDGYHVRALAQMPFEFRISGRP